MERISTEWIYRRRAARRIATFCTVAFFIVCVAVTIVMSLNNQNVQSQTCGQCRR